MKIVHDILEINKETYHYTLSLFLVAVIIESIFTNTITSILRMNLFLLIVVILGLINLAYNYPKGSSLL